MRRLMTATALAAFMILAGGAAHAAPFDCPWTAETDDVPSSGGDYGGEDPPSGP